MNRGQICGPLLLMFCGRCLCVSVSPLDITMSCVEIAEPIEMSFGMWTFMVPGSPRGKAILGASPQFGLFQNSLSTSRLVVIAVACVFRVLQQTLYQEYLQQSVAEHDL